MGIDLIYCAGNNATLFQIAANAGYLLGIRSDRSSCGFPMRFIDVEYKRPDFEKHLAVVAKHRPKYATIPDLSETEVSRADVDRAIVQAESLASYCEIPLIVPKLSGQIAMIPDRFAIGYSIPTSYGGAKYSPHRLTGRKVHLLGGNPQTQMKLYRYLRSIGAEVISTDGNMAHYLAKYAWYWQGGRFIRHALYKKGVPDLYIECWRMSCENIHGYWQQNAKEG